MSPAELTAVDALAVAHEELLHLPAELRGDDSAAGAFMVDVQSEAGHAASVEFIEKMEAAADTLRVAAAPRDYRFNFSVNYLALFPTAGRHYRVDILEASLDCGTNIWVNGDKFELSAEAVVFAEELQRGLAELGGVLTRCREAAVGARPPLQSLQTLRTALVAALTAVDVAWAGFEGKYIGDLIAIEDQARQLVVRAVEAEHRLRRVEASTKRMALTPGGGSSANFASELLQAQQELVAHISRLNAVANHRRKGRDDLGSDILERALLVLGSAGTGDVAGVPGHIDRHSAAQVLADDIVGAFDALRKYLRQVRDKLERVDPHLCNNGGLVSRLVDWEESWEVGGRYVKNTPLLDALCDLVEKIQTIQRLTPTLATMCEECDVELFLVLPRITLLSFLSQPNGKQRAMLQVLLPHRFPGGVSADRELEGLVEHFRAAVATISAVAGDATTNVGWEALVRRAVDGGEQEGDGLAQFAPARRAEAQRDVESFSLELERWSVELQRHCPEDWNQCSAVLVQCLTGESKRQKFAEGVQFQV